MDDWILVAPHVSEKKAFAGRSIIATLLDNHRGHNPMVLPYERLYDGSLSDVLEMDDRGGAQM